MDRSAAVCSLFGIDPDELDHAEVHVTLKSGDSRSRAICFDGDAWVDWRGERID